MSTVAIIGGIGSGKTAVTDYLSTRGAVVVDADDIARDVVQPGQPAWFQLQDAFGTAVLTPEGSLDRPFVAEIVFSDRSALQRLNRITHAAIGTAMVAQIAAHADAALVAVALPLYRPVHRSMFNLDEVWCVWVEPELAVSRLTTHRAFSLKDAEARIANQPSNQERFELADRQFENSGSREQLHLVIDAALADAGWLNA